MTGSEKTVLVVEDNALNRKLFEHILLQGGYAPVCIMDGHDLVEMVSARKPKCVLLDIQLPQTSGLELIKQIRAHEVVRAHSRCGRERLRQTARARAFPRRRLRRLPAQAHFRSRPAVGCQSTRGLTRAQAARTLQHPEVTAGSARNRPLSFRARLSGLSRTLPPRRCAGCWSYRACRRERQR